MGIIVFNLFHSVILKKLNHLSSLFFWSSVWRPLACCVRRRSLRALRWFDLLTDVKTRPGLIAGEALISRAEPRLHRDSREEQGDGGQILAVPRFNYSILQEHRETQTQHIPSLKATLPFLPSTQSVDLWGLFWSSSSEIKISGNYWRNIVEVIWCYRACFYALHWKMSTFPRCWLTLGGSAAPRSSPGTHVAISATLREAILQDPDHNVRGPSTLPSSH